MWTHEYTWGSVYMWKPEEGTEFLEAEVTDAYWRLSLAARYRGLNFITSWLSVSALNCSVILYIPQSSPEQQEGNYWTGNNYIRAVSLSWSQHLCEYTKWLPPKELCMKRHSMSQSVISKVMLEKKKLYFSQPPFFFQLRGKRAYFN